MLASSLKRANRAMQKDKIKIKKTSPGTEMSINRYEDMKVARNE